MQEIDRTILEKAGQGDMRAFRVIYDRASGYVYALAYRVTGRKPEAEEITQDVFLKVYHSLGSFKFEASFKTWLYRVTMNTALNHVKKMRRVAGREIEQENGVASGIQQPDAGTALEAHETEKKLHELLGYLNSDQRACLVLREIEGMDYQGIADALGINLNTVRSRLKRAREALMEIGKREVMSHGL